MKTSVILLLCAGAGWMQAPSDIPVPEISTQESPATFRTGVNLVLVPVVVRDRNGRGVGNLRREDFRLQDKGKPQVITRFSVERRGTISQQPARADVPPSDEARPPNAAERFVLYLFDDLHLNLGELGLSRDAAQHDLDRVLSPATRVAVYTTSGIGNLDFTGDQRRVEAAIRGIQPGRGQESVSECPAITYYVADLIVNRNDPQALGDAAAEAMECRPLPKQTPPNVAKEQAVRLARAAANQVLSVGQYDARRTLDALREAVRRLSAAPGSRSLVLVSPGFLLTSEHLLEEADLIDGAIRAHVTVNSIDARGLFTYALGADQRVRNPAINPSQTIAEAQAKGDILAEVADGTGGVSFRNNNDLRSAFERVAEQPDYLYVLGFSPQNLKYDGSFHPLRVSVRNADGSSVQARHGYYSPNYATDPKEDARQEIREAVFSREELQEIPVDLNVQFVKTGEASARLSVVTKVDVRSLRYRLQDGRRSDDLLIASVLFDRDGNYLKGVQKTVEMRLRDQTLANLRAQGIAVRTTFDVTPGWYAIRLVVRDSEGHMMTARNGSVRIP